MQLQRSLTLFHLMINIMTFIVNQCETPMPHPTYPSPFKRLLVSVYDGLLILAILFIATALTLPFTGGKAVSGNNFLMPVYLLSVIYLFYGWFWTHGGQTLGMRAWKLQLVPVPLEDNAVTWKQSLIRFLTALPAWSLFLLGFLLWMLPAKIEISDWLKNVPEWLLLLSGFIWLISDNRPGNWRDKLSQTEIKFIDKSGS